MICDTVGQCFTTFRRKVLHFETLMYPSRVRVTVHVTHDRILHSIAIETLNLSKIDYSTVPLTGLNVFHITVSVPFLRVIHDERPKYGPLSSLCPSVHLHVTYYQLERLLSVHEFQCSISSRNVVEHGPIS
jgi:hypothetical protein